MIGRTSVAAAAGHASDDVDVRRAELWAERVASHVAAVEDRLARDLAELQHDWDGDLIGDDPATGELHEIDPPAELRRLLGRGGKRTRPVMTLLGWLAADVDGARRGYDDVLLASAALEMLHCFAIVHDDVMDESPTRRGLLTAHESAARLHRRHAGRGDSARFGDSIAMLVGDLAHSEAERLAATLPAPMRRVWQQMVLELLSGQLRDVVGSASGERRLEYARLVARQKTGHYTVARPLQLGAVAASADDEVLTALARYGRHAGEAFALRDDILGVFGDPQLTGKPVGDDIRSGKPTVLLAVATECLRGRAATALQAAGTDRITDAQVRMIRRAMVRDGVLATVESMIDARVADAVAALGAGRLADDGVAQLTHVVDSLARRGR